MTRVEQKVVPDSNRIKTLRAKNGLSITALEDLITALYDEGLCSRKIGKSALHRIESERKPISFERIQIIALALKVEPDSLTKTDKPELQKIRTLNLFKVTRGSDLSSMVQKAKYRFRLDEEPESTEAQDAIIKLLELLQMCLDTQMNLIEETRHNFELRRIISILDANGFAIYAALSKQVAAFSVNCDQNDNWVVDYTLINSPVGNDFDPWGHFEGVSLCDVLLISINKNTNLFYGVEHDMDPAGFIREDTQEACLIENIERVCEGEEPLSVEEFRELSAEEFLSNRARKIELLDRAARNRIAGEAIENDQRKRKEDVT
jgi:transcriptional regulator with XRE-family HTH domain